MKKEEYLKKSEKFIKYFNELVTGNRNFVHKYTVVWPRWKKRMAEQDQYAKKNNYCWRVNSLEEAFRKYYWPPGSYEDNVKVLKNLTTRLTEAKSDLSLFHQCIGVLKWGDVANKGSINWLFDSVEKKDLGRRLKKGVELLHGESEENITEAFDRKKDSLLMNSGFTKIYSLMSETSIIYDGRVGAALCFIIREYLKESEISSIPDVLSFQWGEGRGGRRDEQRKRDPSDEHYQFRRMAYISHEHAILNLRANWLFEAALPEGELWGMSEKKQKLRALESALFMVGADVRGNN